MTQADNSYQAITITIDRKHLEEKIKSIPKLHEKLLGLLESKQIVYYFESHLLNKVSKISEDIISKEGKQFFCELITRENLWENLKIDVMGSLIQQSLAIWLKMKSDNSKILLEDVMRQRLNSQLIETVIDTMALYIEQAHTDIKNKEFELQNSKNNSKAKPFFSSSGTLFQDFSKNKNRRN